MTATQVDFYILPFPHEDSYTYVCRLIEKIYAKGHGIFVWVSSPDESKKLDERLWTYCSDSFLPHTIYNATLPVLAPILIADDTEIVSPPKTVNVLINFRSEVPHFYQHFQRIIEPVAHEPAIQTYCRKKYRCYQDYGCQLHTHHIK
jgi:DNA polymerase-3 subunit chi